MGNFKNGICRREEFFFVFILSGVMLSRRCKKCGSKSKKLVISVPKGYKGELKEENCHNQTNKVCRGCYSIICREMRVNYVTFFLRL